jgi:hypothetical protein
MFSLLQYAVLLLFGLGAILVIGFTYPVFLLTTLVLGAFSFKLGKSTLVPVSSRDVPLSPMRVLSYREFDRWARESDLRLTDPEFFSRADIHWTEKLSVFFLGSDATGHCFEPGRSIMKMLLADIGLGAYVFFPAIGDSFAGLPGVGAILLQFVLGLLLGQVVGRSIGNFYRWMRGQM